MVRFTVSLCNGFKSHECVALKRHLSEVGDSCRRRLEELGITDELLLKAGELIGKTHDFGKYSTYFQDQLKKKVRLNRELSSHAPLSAAYGAWAAQRLIKDPLITAASMLCIYSHHRNLNCSMDSLVDLLDNIVNNINYEKQLNSIMRHIEIISAELSELLLPDLNEFIQDMKDGLRSLKKSLIDASIRTDYSFNDLFRILLLFSVLLDSDKKSAASLKQINRVDIKPDVVENYRASRLAGHFGKIGEYRNALYFDVMNSLAEILRSDNLPRVMTITAPTGTGKTLLGFVTALKLRAEVQKRTGLLPRIIYVLPYINIIEQVHDVLRDVLRSSYNEREEIPISLLLKHHHLYVYGESDDENRSLSQTLLLVESWDSEVIVTTFVQLLETLIGTRNRMLKKFHKLCNSIIIVDEAQTLPVDYWLLVRDSLLELTRNYNSYVIFMTATQPIIFKDATELVKNYRRYFEALDRVVYRYSPDAMSVKDAADLAVAKWRDVSSLLIVANTIATSIELYKQISERLKASNPVRFGSDESLQSDKHRPILAYLSTNIVPKERLRRISTLKRLLKEGRRVIVVSTQLIEAGVDLDFDRTIRDIGPLDSIIQVGGRCNREWLRGKGEVTIVRLVDNEGRLDSVKIYRDLTIRWISEPLLSKWREFSESEMLRLLDEYFHIVNERMRPDSSDKSRSIIEAIRRLDFDKLSRFKLIEEEEPKAAVFVEIDQEAHKVLEDFRELWERRKEGIIDTYELQARLRLQRTRLEKYVVETFREEGLPQDPIADDINIRYIPFSSLDEYYDRETGLRGADRLQDTFW